MKNTTHCKIEWIKEQEGFYGCQLPKKNLLDVNLICHKENRVWIAIVIIDGIYYDVGEYSSSNNARRGCIRFARREFGRILKDINKLD